MFFRKKKRPIIFLHGILGSMGEPIFKGQGELHFGIAEVVYRPFIDDLRRLGYREDRDLFICYYDWTKENKKSVDDYLIPMIKKAKQKTKSDSVDIIGHSMGGLVARTYAQGETYANDINKLIMIATPNLGAANAYYFWSGGDLVSKDSYKNVIYKIIKNSFLWYIKFQYKKTIDMEFVRKNIPSVEQLLPSYGYGDYLLIENSDRYIDIKNMNIQNEFLNKLNEKKDILKERNIEIYNIIGKDINTIEYIKVRRQRKGKETWKDGRPVDFVETNQGDGTVASKSVMSIEGEKIYINSNHTDILLNCKDQLAKILCIDHRNIFRQILVANQEDKKDVLYSIIAKDIKDIDIRALTNSYEIISKQTHENIVWLSLRSIDNNEINLEIKALSDNAKLIVYKVDINKKIACEENINIKDIGLQSIKL